MTTTIVYPLIKSETDMEIKYSLRSLELWFEGDYEVVIIGYLPPYIDKTKVTHIEVEEDPTTQRSDRTRNTYMKLSIAACMFKEFLWMNDDIMLINHKQSIEDLKKPHSAYNMDEWSDARIDRLISGDNIYRHFLWNTFERLQSAGYKDVYYSEIHIPQFVKSKKLAPVFELFSDMPGRFLFYTAYMTMNKKKQPPHCDFKMRYFKSGPVGVLENKYKILNITERTARMDSTKRLLEERFSKKSKFEV